MILDFQISEHTFIYWGNCIRTVCIIAGMSYEHFVCSLYKVSTFFMTPNGCWFGFFPCFIFLYVLEDYYGFDFQIKQKFKANRLLLNSGKLTEFPGWHMLSKM